MLDILAHPNQAKYPRQRDLVVACDNYVYLVPVVEEKDYFFLKTAIPTMRWFGFAVTHRNQASRRELLWRLRQRRRHPVFLY